MITLMRKSDVRKLWMHKQKLIVTSPFGAGPSATQSAIEHLGYVQIDTIHVIERCHHHVLWSRIPKYQRRDLHRAQTTEKSVFEYWTHALSYVPTKDFQYFLPRMNRSKKFPSSYCQSVKPEDLRQLAKRIQKEGALSIRDINDDVLVEKDHAWGSRKPSKKALQLGFNTGQFVVSERVGMLKKYELASRHFSWTQKPKVPKANDVTAYLLDRSLRSQGIVSLDSICYLNAPAKSAVCSLIEQRIKKKELIPVRISGAESVEHWGQPDDLDLLCSRAGVPESSRVHILSPFDSLIIQRKRLKMFFDYDHIFEAYVPKPKRKYGYFGLPVLIGDEVVAVLDLKTDRQIEKLVIQQWTWLPKKKSAARRLAIEEELGRFEAFQFGS